MKAKKRWIDLINQTRRRLVGSPERNVRLSLHITGAACVGNAVVGFGKLIMGLLSISLFACVSAFYTISMVAARCFALAGIAKEKDAEQQYRYYVMSGLILIAASVLYIIYSVRVFHHPVSTSYHEYVAIGIAAFSFAELTLNTVGVIRERKSHAPLLHAIKMINLTSALICLVLTQTAILSFTSTQEELPLTV